MGEDWIKQVDSNYETKTKGHWVSVHASDCLSVENMMNVKRNLCLSGVTINAFVKSPAWKRCLGATRRQLRRSWLTQSGHILISSAFNIFNIF